MCVSLQKAKELRYAIVNVTKVHKTIFFYEANNLLIPNKMIRTQNLKSINIIHISSENDKARYITDFNYHTDKSNRLVWYYTFHDHNWQKETIALINQTLDLI